MPRGLPVIANQRVTVVLPAYNSARTLARTCAEIPRDVVDDVIMTDDSSSDETVATGRSLGLYTICHPRNLGYGANQKTCYKAALRRGADIVIMLHPDYQYTPKLIPAMAAMLTSGHYDAILASRILGGHALEGGMPLYKFIANRALTFAQNILMHAKMSEYHSGYRGWTRVVLEKLPLHHCSDDFVFDNQMLSLALHSGFRVGEISCPTRYFSEASTINLRRSIVYGIGVLQTAVQYRLDRAGVCHTRLFNTPNERGGPVMQAAPYQAIEKARQD